MLKLSTRSLGLTWPNQLLKGLALKNACLRSHHYCPHPDLHSCSDQAGGAQSGHGRFGVDLTRAWVQQLGGRVHWDWNRKWRVIIWVVLRVLSRVIITVIIWVILRVIIRVIIMFIVRYCLVDPKWPLGSGSWSTSSEEYSLHHDHGHRRLHRSSSTTNFAWTRQQQGSWWHRLAQLAHRWRWWWWYYCWWWRSQQTCTAHFPQLETLRMLVDISFLRSSLASPSVAPTGKPGSSMDSPVRKFVALRWLKSKIWFIPSSKFQWRQYKCK